MTDEEFTMPPHWIMAQAMIANRNGNITQEEESVPIMHFCSVECLQEFFNSDEFVERSFLVDDDEDDETPGDASGQG